MEMLNEAARTRSGSRDVGAWLFTSLLRSIGVQTRLVCSLQPLQFLFANEGPRQDFHPSPDKDPALPSPVEMTRDKSHIGISSSDVPLDPPISRKSRTRTPAFPSSTRPTGVYTNPTEYISQTKTFSPNHPFFWSEAFDVASQRWIAIDAIVTGKVNQPSRIEPPNTSAAYEAGAVGDNLLTYVVGYDNSTSHS